jgi:hypothetical protein
MKIPEALKTAHAEDTWSAVFVIFLLLILPSLPLGEYGGGIAMVAVSVIGLIAYMGLFRAHYHWRKMVMAAALAGAVGAAIVIALWLSRGHWSWNRA